MIVWYNVKGADECVGRASSLITRPQNHSLVI